MTCFHVAVTESRVIRVKVSFYFVSIFPLFQEMITAIRNSFRSKGTRREFLITCTKCTCPVLNAPRADTPFCLEYLPEGFSPRADTRDKNGVFVPRAFKQGRWTCNITRSAPSGSVRAAGTICLVQFLIVNCLNGNVYYKADGPMVVYINEAVGRLPAPLRPRRRARPLNSSHFPRRWPMMTTLRQSVVPVSRIVYELTLLRLGVACCSSGIDRGKLKVKLIFGAVGRRVVSSRSFVAYHFSRSLLLSIQCTM